MSLIYISVADTTNAKIGKFSFTSVLRYVKQKFSFCFFEFFVSYLFLLL